ncbi:hypothetical protein BC941DRAFT_415868 [Chlamydoabsidia padenii]|nr:hypothetical protein BC941DRAFT_415868 [Chlamydoabsidia padenii]
MMDQKPATSKLKRLLPKKCKVNILPVTQNNTTNNDNKHVDQHPPGLYRSPINTALYCPFECDQLKPPLQGSTPITTRTSSISCSTKLPVPVSRRSHSLHHTNQADIPPLPPLPSTAIKYSKSKKKLKRHSLSSSPPQLVNEGTTKLFPSPAALASPRLLSKAPSPQQSRSTPLRSKIKTYNVSTTSSQRHGSDRIAGLERGLEKKKRQQELEDLISGRRGSTLKLTLTPKHTLLT